MMAKYSGCVILIAAATLMSAVFAAPSGAEPRRSALANVVDGDAAAKPDDKAPSENVERVTYSENGEQHTVAGRVLIEAQDGGLLLESADGAQHTIEGRGVLNREQTETKFKPLSSKELGDQLLAQLPTGFRVHTTPHYVICYNTSREYAEWTSSLFERLYKAFTSYWRRQGMQLHDPEFPMVVIAFADKSTYEAASRDDLGDAARNIVGYYHLKTNRVYTYDLTGAQSSMAPTPGNRRGSLREINQMLSQRAAVPLVATIVHEATHQIAFNCGLQTRLSDIPLWLCEGMAVYFEAPDLTSSRGWRGIGRVNYPRLSTFRRNQPSWGRNTLLEMLADNQRFRDPQTAPAAYADAWALNFYLIKYHPREYAGYLKTLAAKPPLVEDDPDTRLEEFKAHFGDPRGIERDFLQKMSRVE